LQDNLRKELKETKEALQTAQENLIALQALIDHYSNGNSLDIEDHKSFAR